MADIELVIKLPDNLLKGMKIENGSMACQRILDAVYAGKKLPKGHGVLIDRDAMRKVFEDGGMSWEAGLFDCVSPIIEADI